MRARHASEHLIKGIQAVAEQWYYAQQGQRKGPVSEEQIRQLMSSGQIQPTDLLWKKGMAQWTQASQAFPRPSSSHNAPLPVPKETAQIVSKAKGVAASLVSRGKEAAQLVAKQAERTKITTISLPNSYQALGKHVYKSGNHRSDLAILFQQIDGFLNEVKTIQGRSASQPKAACIADKAAAAAKATRDAAQAQVLQMKANHAVGQLGKAAFETCGKQSGPPELVRPITDLLARVAALDGELSKLQGSGSKQVGTFWNANKENPLFIGPLLLCCFPVGLFLVWKHSVWTSKTKWIWTGAFAALVVVGMIGSHRHDQDGLRVSGGEQPTAPSMQGMPPAHGKTVGSTEQPTSMPSTDALPERILQTRWPESPLAKLASQSFQFPLQSVTGVTSSIQFSPKGGFILVTTASGVRLWQVSTGEEIVATSQDCNYFCKPAAFSPDETCLACIDGELLRVWNLKDNPSLAHTKRSSASAAPGWLPNQLEPYIVG